MTLLLRWFRSPVRWKRSAAVGLLVVAVAVVLTSAGALMGLASGYGGAQSRSASWLADHGQELNEWRDGTTKDLALYIPLYSLVGLIAVVAAIDRPWLSAMLLLGGAAADVVETTRFRSTLDDLIAGRSAAGLIEYTSTTAFLSGAKWALLLASVLVLGRDVVGRGSVAIPRQT